MATNGGLLENEMLDVKMASRALTLTQLARAVGISTEDAEFYWNCGLLQDRRRQRGRHDDTAFHADHVERLRFIKRALGYGFSLDAIAQFVDTNRMMTCNDVYRIAVHQVEELRRVGGPNGATADRLEKLIAACRRTGGRKDCAIMAALENEDAGPTGG